MRVLAVIADPQQALRILRHLIKTGAAPLKPAAAQLRQERKARRGATGLDVASLC